jgi:hypothetical protein
VEYVVTVTIAGSGGSGEAGAVLDAFLSAHGEAGPIVAESPSAETLDVTFAVDAESAETALDLGRSVFADGMRGAPVAAQPILGLRVELADGERQVA